MSQGIDDVPESRVEQKTTAVPQQLAAINTGRPAHPRNGAGWYILRCGAGTEFRARDALCDSGFSAYLPIEKKWRATLFGRRSIEVDYPRFPRYLFVRVAPPLWPPFGRWPLSAFVRGVLGMNGEPVRLAPGELERLQAEDGQLVVPVTSLHKAFVPGMQVRVRLGPFASFEAALDAIDERGAHLTLQMLGRPTPVVQPLAWLEAA
jgi:transcription antitermination factor NusG